MGKIIPKFRNFDDDDYNSSKDFNKNKKRKKQSAEFRKLRQRHYEEEQDYGGFLDKKFKYDKL